MATVHVIDPSAHNLTAEQSAKLQALYSRNASSVMTHIKDIQSDDVSAWMDKFYVGYGHDSIGQLGTTTVHAENISLLAAKHIQNADHFSGQELSTRYVDLTNGAFYYPIAISDVTSGSFYKRWHALYKQVIEFLTPVYKELHPNDGTVSDTVWSKTIAAKVFDVARGWLPIATLTNTSWHTPLNYISRYLPSMRYSELGEMRDIGFNIFHACKNQYPGSFSEKDAETAAWEAIASRSIAHDLTHTRTTLRYHLDKTMLAGLEKIASIRQPKQVLPPVFNDVGTIEHTYVVDFGGWRDVQRHRSGQHTFVKVNPANGMHLWYMNEVAKFEGGDAIVNETIKLFADVKVISEILNIPDTQYLCPLMTNVKGKTNWSLAGFFYSLERRSGKDVHPTVRLWAQEAAELYLRKGEQAINDLENYPLFVNQAPDVFYTKRGTQDIVEVNS